jgi:hypothetical protein
MESLWRCGVSWSSYKQQGAGTKQNILIDEHGNGCDSEFATGLDDTTRDLSSVCNQDLSDNRSPILTQRRRRDVESRSLWRRIGKKTGGWHSQSSE